MAAGMEAAIRPGRDARRRGVGRGRSVARVDFLVRDGEVWLNEINTIPGQPGGLSVDRSSDCSRCSSSST